MNLFPGMSKKRREAAAREFLSKASAQFDGSAPPLAEDDVVRLRTYGSVARGTSSIAAKLIRSAKKPLDIRLVLESTGASAHELLLDQRHAARLIEFAAQADKDLRDLKKVIDRKPGEVLSERDIEVLRLFQFEAVGNRFGAIASRHASAEARV